MAIINIPFKLKKQQTVMIQLLHDQTIEVKIYDPIKDTEKHIGTFKGAYSDLYWSIFRSTLLNFIGNGSGQIISLKMKELLLNQDSNGNVQDIDVVI